MALFPPRLSLPMLALGWLVVGGAAHAARPGVFDTAGLFKDDKKVRKAHADMVNLQHRFRKDFVLETYRTPPADQEKQFETPARDELFARWARERAHALAVNGIYVLICEKPPHLEVFVDEATSKKEFPPPDQISLESVLLKAIEDENKAKGAENRDYTAALLAAVDFVEKQLNTNLPGTPLLDSQFPAPVPNQVLDLGKFFESAPLQVQKTNELLAEIKQKFRRDILVETLPAMTRSKINKYPRGGLAGLSLSNWFDDWAQERLKLAKTDGIAILVCREPESRLIGVGVAADRKLLSGKERDKIRNILLTRLKEKRYADALNEAVESIFRMLDARSKGASAWQVPAEERMRDQAKIAFFGGPGGRVETGERTERPRARGGLIGAIGVGGDAGGLKATPTAPPPPPASAFNWMWLVWAGLILLGVWVFVGLLRALSGGSTRRQLPEPQPLAGGALVGQSDPPPLPAASGEYPAAAPLGGGGGFFTGVLGGMFGAAAGSWLYDRFLRSPSPGSYTMPRPSEPWTGATPAESGFPGSSASGGDYGASGGRDSDYDAGTSGGDIGAPTGGGYGGYVEDPSGGDYGYDAGTSGGDFGYDSGDVGDAGGGDFGGTD